MAKHYTTIVVEGRPLSDVEQCLESVVGPLLRQWRGQHLLGVHLDISDVSDAVRYGMTFEAEDATKPCYPVVEVDLYASRDRPTRTLEAELANIIAAGIAAGLGVEVRIRATQA